MTCGLWPTVEVTPASGLAVTSAMLLASTMALMTKLIVRPPRVVRAGLGSMGLLRLALLRNRGVAISGVITG